MTQAPKRIWVDYTPNTETYQHVDTDNPQDGSTEYIRADLIQERIENEKILGPFWSFHAYGVRKESK